MILKINIALSQLEVLKNFLDSDENKFVAPTGFYFLQGANIEGKKSIVKVDTLSIFWMPRPPKNYGGWLSVTLFVREDSLLWRQDQEPANASKCIFPAKGLRRLFDILDKFPIEQRILSSAERDNHPFLP